MSKNKLIAFVTFIILALSCGSNEERNSIQLDPEVVTISSSIGVNGGVTLFGNYIPNENEISEAGFEYSINQDFQNKTTLKSELNSNNELEYFLANGIKKNLKYFYRAFVTVHGKKYYGESKHFISDGSVSPQINSISNNFGHIVDTLEIHGKYFKDGNSKNTVNFSGTKAVIISLNDTLIKCQVPPLIKKITTDIKVTVGDRADTYSSFTLYEPTIENITPINSLIGDTILIKGSHFDIANSRNKVFFGKIPSKIIESYRDSIKVIVPENIETSSELVKLNTQLQNTTYNTPFKLLSPEIKSITPLNATFREELTITGNNFDFKTSRNKVLFGNIEATITYADKNTIKVIVPDNLESSSVSIKVVAQLQEVTYTEKFKLIPPKINFIPKNVNSNQEITIQGDYFHPILEKNKVTIENINVNLISGDTKTLNTKIPYGPFPRRKAIVKIQLLDILIQYEVELNILDKWLMISDNLPFSYNRSMGNAAVANNTAFVVSISREILDSNYYLWSYNDIEKSWTKVDLPFTIGVNESGGVLESNGTMLYLYLPNDQNDFWEYDPTNKKWSKKTPFKGNKRAGATHFSINNEIYIGLGKDYSPYIPISYNDLYKYSPSTDKWEKLSDVPFTPYQLNGRTETATFVINGIGYFAGGALTTGDYHCWSYNASTNTWVRIADFNTSRSYSSGFTINGLGYVTGGTPVGGGNRKDCWQYNPSTNSWLQVDDIGHFERAGHFTFVLNGKVYLGGGGIYNSGGIGGYDFYEFIP